MHDFEIERKRVVNEAETAKDLKLDMPEPLPESKLERLAAELLREQIRSTAPDLGKKYRSGSDIAADELKLFEGLAPNAYEKGLNRIKEQPGLLSQDLISGLAFGALIASAARNPALLGKSFSCGVMNFAERSAPIFIGMAAVDWSYRLGAPVYQVYKDQQNLAAAKEDLAINVGHGVLDYSVSALGGIAGAGLAWKFSPQWQNRAPSYELRPSLKLGEQARRFDSAQESMRTNRESSIADDLAQLYEKSFPVEERQAVSELTELVERGRILVHATRDADGKLQAFSFTSLHDESATKFANLDFIATNEASRSRGIGSLHFSRLRDAVAKEYPQLAALTLEMEHPAQIGLEPALRAVREYRAKFYDRLDAPDTLVKYSILDFADPGYRGPAQWRAWAYKPEEFNAVKAARTMLMDEGGYGLSKSSPAVREFDRANNYWEAPFGTTASGIYAAIASSNLHSYLLDWRR